MSKWEDKYNEYKDGGIDNVINEFVSKGVTTKERKKEYDKLVKIKGKMPQVANVIEKRDKLQEEVKQLKAELETRRTLTEASKKVELLGKEIDRLQEQSEKIDKQLKNPKLTDEKRAELQAEQDKIGPKMAKVQDEIGKNEGILNSAVGIKREFREIPTEDLQKQIEDKDEKRKMCNTAARMLIEGKNWELIGEKLDNWQNRKFTSKDGKLNEKIENKKNKTAVDKENKVEDKTSEDLKKKREEKVNEFIKDYTPDFENYGENKPDLTFADKHPKLAKIGNFFKGIKDKFIKKEKDNVENTEIKDPVKKDEGVKEENKENKSFKEELRRIAEIGIDGIEAEEKAARQQAAKEKLAKMRADNRTAETEKFGKEYAEQSDYRSNDDEGR